MFLSRYGKSRLTWYRSLGGALNFCNITFWIVSASVRSWAGERLPLITSILTRGIVLVKWDEEPIEVLRCSRS